MSQNHIVLDMGIDLGELVVNEKKNVCKPVRGCPFTWLRELTGFRGPHPGYHSSTFGILIGGVFPPHDLPIGGGELFFCQKKIFQFRR